MNSVLWHPRFGFFSMENKCSKLITCNSTGLGALILVQSIVTNVPLVLLRASRRHMRCGGGGVNMPKFSEAPASIALMWICGAPTGDQTKTHSLYFKKGIHQTPIALRMGQLLVLNPIETFKISIYNTKHPHDTKLYFRNTNHRAY